MASLLPYIPFAFIPTTMPYPFGTGASLLSYGCMETLIQEVLMRAINIITLLLVIVGGLNWGLVGLFQFDLVATLFGGQDALLARIVYILVGVSAVWQLIPLIKSFSDGETHAQRTHR